MPQLAHTVVLCSPLPLCRCRKLLLQLKSKKEEYDKLMDKLQKDVRERYSICTSFPSNQLVA